MEIYECEQLEEGEIVDDDDFEDISDNSIIDSNFGKFVSTNENLRALSLSSDSEMELYIKRRKKLLSRKSKIKRQKKRKRHKISSDSSDNDVSTCQDLKGKLKEAVHISEIMECEKKPLETRLKAMRGLSNNKNMLTEVLEQPCKVENEDSPERIDDHELEKLRIEALKTAVLNKFQRRKRKKIFLDEQNEGKKSLETLENKENDTPKSELKPVNSSSNIEKTDPKSTIVDIEEDEDVLRASLLAGLAKKITKVQTYENIVQTKPAAPILPKHLAPVLPKPPINNTHNVHKKIMQNRPKPQVKPLIIKVNGDSDTDEEIKQKPLSGPPSVNDLKVITSNVEKFLKEQRAKFETETKQKFQIVHKNKSLLEKSAVKLLPQSQQIEYQQLLKKLKTAERKKKAKKLALQKLKSTSSEDSQKCVVPKVTSSSVAVEVPLISAQPQVMIKASSKSEVVNAYANPPITTKNTLVDQVVQTSRIEVTSQPDVKEKLSREGTSYGRNVSKKENEFEKKKSGITNELTTLQKTLKEIKMQRNGSLQIKSKYQVLTPIIRKITATSNERKTQEQRIKKLLKELNEARNSLSKSHEKFSSLVRELVDKKEKIDKSCMDTKTSDKDVQNGFMQNTCVEESEDENCRKKCRENIKKTSRPIPVTSTPIKQQTGLHFTEEAVVSTFNTSSTNNDYEDMDVCNSDEADMCQIDIVDPNDIDQIFTRKSSNKLTLPEYISPLNLNTSERYKHVDPHGIMCPYEVNGACRDFECTFKHYLKNNVKQ